MVSPSAIELYFSDSWFCFCRFVKGTKPGHRTGFDIDDDIFPELDQFHDVIVASAIFG